MWEDDNQLMFQEPGLDDALAWDSLFEDGGIAGLESDLPPDLEQAIETAMIEGAAEAEADPFIGAAIGALAPIAKAAAPHIIQGAKTLAPQIIRGIGGLFRRRRRRRRQRGQREAGGPSFEAQVAAVAPAVARQVGRAVAQRTATRGRPPSGDATWAMFMRLLQRVLADPALRRRFAQLSTRFRQRAQAARWA